MRMKSSVAAAVLLLAMVAAPAEAQRGRGGAPGGGGGMPGGGGGMRGGGGNATPRPPSVGAPGRAVPRTSPLPSRVGPFRSYGARPYYYGPRLGLGYSYYSPYGYFGLGWGSPYYGYYGYGYGYGYPGYGYGYGYTYPYPYGYPSYGYPSEYLYGGAQARAVGEIRVQDAPKDAEIYVDGYYEGIVDDASGPFHSLRLEAGPHKIEIRAPGFETATYDVNVDQTRTITVHARLRPAQP